MKGQSALTDKEFLQTQNFSALRQLRSLLRRTAGDGSPCVSCFDSQALGTTV